ncbi:MAG: rRNA pseudouridine synthase [Lachnospiraceae bacterium]|nr:rRNA pseudouridine synthase [Lachnospiraceae bacterium]
MRLDKLVAELTGMTRSQARDVIVKGRVCVNGEVKKTTAEQVKEDSDVLTLDGEKLTFQKFVYYMLNKPAGTVSATQDRDAKTVLSLLTAEDKKRRNLFPVGRLDKDTEGLLFLTDDGMLSHQLISPKKHADKLYFAKLARDITDDDIKVFASGMKVDEELTAMPAVLRRLSDTELAGFLPMGGFGAAVTLHEGKFHQVKRMFAATGNEVLYLKRMAMGGVYLDETLAPGEYRSLRSDELQTLQDSVRSEG